MKKLPLKVLIVFSVLFITLVFSAQSQSRQRLRELDQKEKQRTEEEAAANAAAKEKHLSIQSKSTRKEMKRYKKMSKRHNKNRKTPFWKKIRIRKRK